VTTESTSTNQRRPDAPLYIACQNGKQELVKLLLTHKRIAADKPEKYGFTPFSVACRHGKQEVVSLLLADPRVDVNMPNSAQCTPLWQASQDGHLEVVQLLLASGRKVHIKTRSIAGNARWNDTTAAEVARYRAELQNGQDLQEGFLLRLENCPQIAALLKKFQDDPATTRQQLRELPHLRDSFISEVFALVVFLSDDLLSQACHLIKELPIL